jgi:hypothetical protein
MKTKIVFPSLQLVLLNQKIYVFYFSNAYKFEIIILIYY